MRRVSLKSLQGVPHSMVVQSQIKLNNPLNNLLMGERSYNTMTVHNNTNLVQHALSLLHIAGISFLKYTRFFSFWPWIIDNHCNLHTISLVKLTLVIKIRMVEKQTVFTWQCRDDVEAGQPTRDPKVPGLIPSHCNISWCL